MTRSRRILTAVAVATSVLALLPAAGQAARKTETLRFFSKDVAMTHTTADGTVHRKPPFPEPSAGDVLDLFSVGYRGDHRRHAERSTMSAHVTCVFGTDEPDCISHVAIGSALLVFEGYPGTMIAGTARYHGATGRVIRNKEVEGGSDVVARIRLRARPGAAASPGAAPPAEEPAWERALRLRGEAMNRLLR